MTEGPKGLISLSDKKAERERASKAKAAEIAANKAKLGIGAPVDLPVGSFDFNFTSDTIDTNFPNVKGPELEPLEDYYARIIEAQKAGTPPVDPDKISWTPTVLNKKGEEIAGKPKLVSLSGDSRVESTRKKEEKKKAKRQARTARQELKSYRRNITLAERVSDIGTSLAKGFDFVKKGAMLTGALGGLFYGVKTMKEKEVTIEDLAEKARTTVAEIVKPIPEKIQTAAKDTLNILSTKLKEALLKKEEIIDAKFEVKKEISIVLSDIEDIKAQFNKIIEANNEFVNAGGDSYFSNPEFLQKYNEIAVIYRQLSFYFDSNNKKVLFELLENMENKVEELRLLIPQNKG